MGRKIKLPYARSGSSGLRTFVSYGKYIFNIPNGIYQPNYDSVFLVENLKVKKGESVLDLGTGAGFFAINISKRAGKILAVDFDERAISCAKSNAKLNGCTNIKFRKSDMFSNVKERFDLILVDPPQIPTPPMPSFGGDIIEGAVNGGPYGRDVLDPLIRQTAARLKRGGRVQIYHSELCDIKKSFSMMKECGLRPEITASRDGSYGRTTRERLWYYKKIGIKIRSRNGVPIQKYYILTGHRIE